MTDTELLERVLAGQGMDAAEMRRNEHETLIEFSARMLYVAMNFVNNNLGVLDQMMFIRQLEESRTDGEWRGPELLNDTLIGEKYGRVRDDE